jgi:hypothetical protein
MTTAPSSWRSRSLVAAAAALTMIANASTAAHRRDEYLQAARIGIDPGRVQLELDLTPGIALAQGIVADIDRNRNGSIDADEAQAYCVRVLSEIQLDLDGQPLPLELIARQFPTEPAMFNGEGTIELRLAAQVPALAAGTHRVMYRNVHRTDIGVYLANALVPTSDRVSVIGQARDVDQRALTIEYTLRDDGANWLRWWLVMGLAGAMAIATVVLLRR